MFGVATTQERSEGHDAMARKRVHGSVLILGLIALGVVGIGLKRSTMPAEAHNAITNIAQENAACGPMPTMGSVVEIQSPAASGQYLSVCSASIFQLCFVSNGGTSSTQFKVVPSVWEVNGSPVACYFSLESVLVPGRYIGVVNNDQVASVATAGEMEATRMAWKTQAAPNGGAVLLSKNHRILNVKANPSGLHSGCPGTTSIVKTNWDGTTITNVQTFNFVGGPDVTLVKEPFSTYAHMKNFILTHGCPDTAFEDPNYGATGANIFYRGHSCEVSAAAVKIRVGYGYGGSIFRKVAEYKMTSGNSLSCTMYKQASVSGPITFLHHGWNYRCNGYEQYLRLIARGPFPQKVLPQAGVVTTIHNLMKQSTCPQQVILKSAANTEFVLTNKVESCEQQNNWNTEHISTVAFGGNVVLFAYTINSTPGVTKLTSVCLTVWNPAGSITSNYACHNAGASIDLSGSGLNLAPAPFVFTVDIGNMLFVY